MTTNDETGPPSKSPPRKPRIPDHKHCLIYRPGHSVHWIQGLSYARQSGGYSSVRCVEVVDIDGEVITVSTPGDIHHFRNDQGEFVTVRRPDRIERFRHHQTDLLRVLLQLGGNGVMISHHYSMMRAGGFEGGWLSIAPDTGEPLGPCRTEYPPVPDDTAESTP